jgi:hypothetical protein
MAEGSVWWALDKAAHYRLGNLTAIVDVNQRGPTELERDLDACRRGAETFGCAARVVDGQDVPAIDVALAAGPAGRRSCSRRRRRARARQVRAAAGPAVRGLRPARLRHPDELMEPAGYHRAPDRSGPPAA